MGEPQIDHALQGLSSPVRRFWKVTFEMPKSSSLASLCGTLLRMTRFLERSMPVQGRALAASLARTCLQDQGG
jgi:hypothetical protein